MRNLFFALLLFASCLLAQAPDCTFTSVFTSAAPGSTVANKSTATGGTPCLYWEFTYWTNGATGVSVKLEGTNDVAGAAGASFTALTAATATGTTNPATGTNQGGAVLCCDYYPWLRINPTTFTGSGLSMTVRVYGWRTQPVPAVGGGSASSNVNVQAWGGTATSLGQKAMASSVPIVVASDQSTLPVNTAQVNGHTLVEAGVNGVAAVGGSAAVGAAPASDPIPIAQLDSGGNLITPDYCTLKAQVNNTSLGTGSTQLVAVSGSTTIRVCKVSFTTDTLTTFKLVTGTGASCTTPTNETATYSGAGGGVFGVIEDYASPLITTAAKTLCVNLSAGVTTTGGITILYSQR